MPKLKNPKHELLAKKIVEKNFNLTEAYSETYPNSSRDSARSSVCDVLAIPSVKERIDEIAERKGLTAEFEIDRLLSAHDAMRPVIVGGKKIDYPDYAVRLEAIKTGLKLHGALGDQTVNNYDNRSVNITMTDPSVDRLAATVDKMQAIRARLEAKQKRD